MASSPAPPVDPPGVEKSLLKRPPDSPGCCGVDGLVVDPVPLGEAAGGGGGPAGVFFISR